MKESINTAIFSVLKVSEKSRVPVLIMSNPGLGKSTTVKMFADVRGYHLQLLRGNSTSETEVLGYDVAVDTFDGKKTTTHTRPVWYNRILEKQKEGKPTLLFLDEITTASPYVQSALLHLIFERMVGEDQLPEDTLIVSAGNYAQNLNSQMDVLAPLMNRFLIFNITPTVDDLDTFLCKYSGAIANDGKIPDYFDTVRSTMKEIDSQEITTTPEQKNMIGEYIERGIKETTKFLMTSGDRPIDFNVKDLQGLYSDDDTDSKLCGFATLRTLNYLREVTMAVFHCFGKAGILSSNYRNMIDGLCGFGISRDPKTKAVKKTYIGKEFFDSMSNIVNDIEKMNNSQLPEYERFFKDILKSSKKNGKLEISEMNALINKVEELRNNKSISKIERPIDPSILKEILNLATKSGKSSANIKIGSNEKILDRITPEDFTGKVTYWNTVAKTVKSLGRLVNGMKYKSDTVSEYESSLEDVRNDGFKLRSLRKLACTENLAIGKLIPEIESIN